jgi:hypothetical protein
MSTYLAAAKTRTGLGESQCQVQYVVGSLQFSFLLAIQPSDGCHIANRLMFSGKASEGFV